MLHLRAFRSAVSLVAVRHPHTVLHEAAHVTGSILIFGGLRAPLVYVGPHSVVESPHGVDFSFHVTGCGISCYEYGHHVAQSLLETTQKTNFT